MNIVIAKHSWHDHEKQRKCPLRPPLAAAVVSITSLLGSVALADSPQLPAKELALACRSAIRAIESYQAKVSVFRPLEDVPSGAEVGPDGLMLLQQFDCAWDRRTGRQMAKGRELMATGKETSKNAWYRRFWGAWDGEKLRTFGLDVNQGQIIHSSGELTKYWSIRDLLGYGLASRPKRDLADLLDESAATVVAPDAPKDVLAVEVNYIEGADTAQPMRHLVRVWIDQSHGFLPSRVDVRREVFGVDQFVEDHLIEITRFFQTAEGVWVPTEGREILYGLNAEFPAGMTARQASKLSKEDWKKIQPQVRYYASPIAEPSVIRIDESTLQVNNRIPDEIFTIDFPKGSKIYDEFAVKNTASGSLPSKTARTTKQPSTTTGRSLLPKLVIANSIVVLLLALGFGYKLWCR